MSFREKIAAAASGGSGLCIGLDPVLEKMPEKLQSAEKPLLSFNMEVIEATAEYAAAYKPNLAFYEAYGWQGWQQLEETIKAIPEDKIVIADGKRGDIGNTSRAYSRAVFERLGSDALTVSPFLGSDSIQPFIENPQNGIFLLAVTSNPGGKEIQNLVADGIPVYQHVIEIARRINDYRNIGLVVGATRAESWSNLLEIAIDMPLLIPGIGAQGGDIATLKNALKGYPAPALINASRSIIYASSGEDYKIAMRQAAAELHDKITD